MSEFRASLSHTTKDAEGYHEDSMT